jgi:hypothetical protein
MIYLIQGQTLLAGGLKNKKPYEGEHRAVLNLEIKTIKTFGL